MIHLRTLHRNGKYWNQLIFHQYLIFYPPGRAVSNRKVYMAHGSSFFPMDDLLYKCLPMGDWLKRMSTCYSEKFLSLVTLCFVVAVHPCMGKIPVYKKNCSLVDRSRHRWIVQIVRLRTKWLWVPVPFLSLKLGACFMSRSFLTFRQTIESRFTLKLVRDMIKTYSHEIFALWFVGFREISLYSWFTCQSSEKKH